MKYILLIALFLLNTQTLSGADCPSNSKDLLVNTQDKYDNIYLKYPNCTAFTIIKSNGKFIGDPQSDRYVMLLTGMLIGILIALKLLFRYIPWFDKPIV